MQLNDLDTRTQILEKLWDVVGLLRLLGLGTGKFQFQSICWWLNLLYCTYGVYTLHRVWVPGNMKKCSIQSWRWLAKIRHSTPKNAPNIFSMDMLSVKWLKKICFFILLFTWISIYISDIYTRRDNVNTSLNIVTESLLPFKQALCKTYFDNILYSINGKLTISCGSGSSIIHHTFLCLSYSDNSLFE